MPQTRLTILNLYELTAPPSQFEQAIAALAHRVEAEGDPGVLSYRFFVNPVEGTARAVIDYATPAAWIGHHETAMNWPEMSALHTAARLSEIVFLGTITPEIRAWLENSSLSAALRTGNEFAAGFQRALSQPPD